MAGEPNGGVLHLWLRVALDASTVGDVKERGKDIIEWGSHTDHARLKNRTQEG
jgi:hypothetical protein